MKKGIGSMKKLAIILATAMMLTLFSGCESDSVPADNTLSTPDMTLDITLDPLPDETPSEQEPQIHIPEYGETDIAETLYDPEEFSATYEAELGTLKGLAYNSAVVGGYSGDGYVAGVSLPDSGLLITAEVPSSQHYSVTLCAYSEFEMNGVLYVDGVAKGVFALGGTGAYESVMFDNIYIHEGEVTVSFGELTADIYIDYIVIENCEAIYAQPFSVSGRLSNAKASSAAEDLYEYICESFGNSIISAQQVTPGTNNEIDAIYQTTGQYPAIRFSDMMDYGVGIDSGDTELALEWAKDGGIVGYSWYWVKGGSCYSVKSDFDITTCINDHDVARLSEKRLAELYEAGGVSDETVSLLEDIDRVAEQLARFKEAGVAVLFRPLPEASSGQFWWGEDKEAYLWLWELVYARLADYWHLDNLIWVWNAQSFDWYVGDDWCDIISLDIYDFSGQPWDNQSHINQLLGASSLGAKKPVAISECNVLPGPGLISQDGAYWAFVSLWQDYALDSNGKLNTKTISEAEWILYYNCSVVVTRDELK